MKKLSAALFLVCLSIIVNGQISTRNFKEIQKKFYAEFEHLKKQHTIQKEKTDKLLQRFHRWEYLLKSRTFPSGIMPDGDIQWREWQRYQNGHASEFDDLTTQPKWQQVGKNIVPAYGGGAGRVNVIRIHPADTNIIYIGSAGGGVWKSTDGGNSWSTTTDKYPVTSIADIAIDATNGNNIYVATGDGAGYEVGDDFWGGVYTAGILRSTDGGTTWMQVGREIPQDSRSIIQRLIINPSHPNILLVATRHGIYQTTNSDTSWKKVLTHHCYDMEWNTSNPNVVYAGGDDVLYRSKDAGATWEVLASGFGVGRMSIEVSASNPRVIYVLTGSTFYRSGDGGKTWKLKSYPTTYFYGYYDLILSCAAANSDYLVAGGFSTVESTDGGNSWTEIDYPFYGAPNYVHVDKHAATFYPTGTKKILLGSDGGVFKTGNGGDIWSDISNGLMIAQIYRLGTTPQNVNLVTSGWQDNGINKWDGTDWTCLLYFADGMETAIDYTNQKTIYGCFQYGLLNRSDDGGNSWTYGISPTYGDWVTPFVIDPVLHKRLYFGSFNLYKSENRGNNWSAVNNVMFGTYAQAIAVAPSNNNIVYAASLDKMYKVNILRDKATVVTSGLPVDKAGINYIAVSGNNPDKVWVALSGYSDGNKVFRSLNGGTSWTNISGTLPNLPVNTIVYQNNCGHDRLFAGTDIGVYYIDNTLTDWKYYGKNLPNVMVHELEINYTSNKLVAATYGRGIWQIDIPTASQEVIAKQVTTPELKVNLFPNPTAGLLNIHVINAPADVVVTVYTPTGEPIIRQYDAKAAKTIKIDLSTQPSGNYICHLKSGEATATKIIQLNK